MRFLILTFAPLPLAACSMDEGPIPIDSPAPVSDGLCNAAPIQSYVGAKVSAELRDELIAKSGASIFQWVPPNTAVTMDYRQERLRVSYDGNELITRLTCG